MIQGSNMTGQDKGMRKGISLVEMLVAIVLFGLIGVISYNYYKVYYDTAFAAKQARVYTILDQAQQLSNAHDLYETKNGANPIIIDNMVTDKIIKEQPPVPMQVSTSGWKLYNDQTGADANISIELGDSSLADNDVAFVLTLDGNATSTTATADKDLLDYCNILNNTANTTWSLSSTDANITTNIESAEDGYTNISNYFFCDADENGTTPYGYRFVFVKQISAD